MRPLAPRLQVIHDMVRPVAVAADIGCENAALGVALVLSGRAQRLIASDISRASVEAAQATVRRLLSPEHAAAVDIRLGDGLDAIAPHEHVDTVTMAGIALPRMQRILRNPRVLYAPGGGGGGGGGSGGGGGGGGGDCGGDFGCGSGRDGGGAAAPRQVQTLSPTL